MLSPSGLYSYSVVLGFLHVASVLGFTHHVELSSDCLRESQQGPGERTTLSRDLHNQIFGRISLFAMSVLQTFWYLVSVNLNDIQSGVFLAGHHGDE